MRNEDVHRIPYYIPESEIDSNTGEIRFRAFVAGSFTEQAGFILAPEQALTNLLTVAELVAVCLDELAGGDL